MDPDVTKKLKGLDGAALPVDYDIARGDTRHLVLEASKSLEQNIDGLTDGTHGNTKADCHTQRSNGSESITSSDNDVKVRTQVSPTKGEANPTTISGPAPPAGFVGVSLGSPYDKVGISTAFAASSAFAGLPFNTMVMDQRRMKREKRKQANRESARRSRMRKQMEYDELVKACDSLNTEQLALKSAIEELKGYSEKLMLENAALREKLEIAQALPQGGLASVKIEVDLDLPNDAGNIPRNLGSVNRNAELALETQESSMSETKLHAVAAR